MLLILILKIIGITLVSIVGLLLFLLLMLLFWPIQYRMKGNYDEKEAMLSVTAFWLCHLVSAKGYFLNGEIHYYIKILFFTLFSDIDGPKKNKKAKKKKEDTIDKKSQKESVSVSKKKEETITEKLRTESTNAESAKAENTKSEEIREVSGSYEKDKNNQGNQQKKIRNRKTFFLCKIWYKLKAFFRNLWYTLKHMCDKMKNIVGKLAYYVETIQKEENAAAIELVKEKLYKVWKNIKPRKMKIQIQYGAKDPADTGQVLAIYSMFYPIFFDKVILVPSFERECLYAAGKVKGHMTVFVWLLSGWKLFRDKKLKRFIKEMKKGGNIYG